MEDTNERDLTKEQRELILLLERHVPPRLLEAVDFAYHYRDEAEKAEEVDISSDGTGNA